MFDIGFLELVLIGVLSLLVLGPERLPGAIKTTSLWISRLRRSFQQIKTEIEREIGADEIKQQIHNESIMKSLKKTKSNIENNIQDARSSLENELGDTPYDVKEIFRQQGDTLPNHEPLPDPYDFEEPDEPEDADKTPSTDSSPRADKP